MRKLLMILSIILLGLNVMAQVEGAPVSRGPDESLFMEDTQKSYTLMHITGSFEQKEHTNQLITAMGELSGLTPATSFRTTFNYRQKLEVNRVSGQLMLVVTLQSKGLGGRLNPRGFDVANLLVPDRMNCRVQLLNEGGSVLYEQEQNDVNLTQLSSGKEVKIASITIPDTWPGSRFSLRITEVVSPQAKLLFYHTVAKANAMKVFKGNIMVYEQDAATLASNNNKIKAFSYDDPDRLQSQMQELEGYKRFTDEVIAKDFATKLNLQQSDPKRLLPALEEFATLYHETQKTLQEKLRNLDEMCYQKGMMLVAKNDLKGALAWFSKSLGHNPGHIGSNLQIAKIDLQQGRVDEAKARAEKILTMNPDRPTLTEVNKLLASIKEAQSVQKTNEYRAIISQAEREWNQGNRPEGLRKLEEASQLQSNFKDLIPDNKEVMQVFSRFAGALTSDADRNLKLGKFELALNQYKDALQLVTQNAGTLSSGGFFQDKINEVHTTVLGSLITRLQVALSRSDWNQAEETMDDIFGYLNRNTEVAEPPLLQGLIGQLQMGFYGDGERMIARKNYPQAFELLNRCLQFSQKAGIPAPAQIYRLLDEARNGIFVSLLMSGQQSMNSRDISGAEYYLNEAILFLQNKMSPQSADALDAYKSNLMELYLKQADQHRASGQFEKAIGVYQKAQESQYTFGLRPDISIPAYITETREEHASWMLDDVQPLIDRKQFPQAVNMIKEVADYMDQHSLAGNAQGKLETVVDRCFRDMLQEADRLNRAKSYGDALPLLTDGWYLCRNYTFRCDENLLVARERESRTGIHKGMVADASTLFGKGDLAGAKAKTQEAVRYRETYPDYVTSAKEEAAMMGKIRQKEYQAAVSSGKGLLDKKEYRQALGYFDEATNLEAQGGFTSDAKLKEYRKTAAHKVIMAEADQLEAMLNQGNLMGTKDKMLQIMTMRNQYNLLDNKEIETRLKSLQGRMVSAACLKQQEAYEASMDKAYLHAKAKDFITAGKEIRIAIEAANRLPECALSDSSAQRYLVQLTPAIQYQEQYRETIRLLEQYKNPEAVKAYMEAEEMYNRNSVQVYGIEHEPFATFAVQQNLNFILAAAFRYRDLGNNEAAMKMLKELASKGYPAAQTRLLQEQIGYDYGKMDAKKYPGSGYKTAVVAHTSGSKYWKYFKKAYSKGWKSGL